MNFSKVDEYEYFQFLLAAQRAFSTAVMMGINLISLLRTDGEAHLPCDFRLYNRSQDGLTKNNHFQNMLKTVHERGFEPELVAFDSWYSSLENLKLVRSFG